MKNARLSQGNLKDTEKILLIFEPSISNLHLHILDDFSCSSSILINGELLDKRFDSIKPIVKY